MSDPLIDVVEKLKSENSTLQKRVEELEGCLQEIVTIANENGWPSLIAVHTQRVKRFKAALGRSNEPRKG